MSSFSGDGPSSLRGKDDREESKQEVKSAAKQMLSDPSKFLDGIRDDQYHDAISTNQDRSTPLPGSQSQPEISQMVKIAWRNELKFRQRVLLAQRDLQGRTPLHEACSSSAPGSFGILQMLLALEGPDEGLPTVLGADETGDSTDFMSDLVLHRSPFPIRPWKD
tara:strand:+ start:3258 stop:3749 length:492 start_codon:yes stop_codon:yes gene_type:complete